MVVEEIEATVFWLGCISDNGIVASDRMKELIREANELVAIFTAARKSVTSPGQA